MIALFDFLPKHCPNCGEEKEWSRKHATHDYFALCSHGCACGLHYQFCKTDILKDAADKTGGDLPQYT